ncbi:MAG: hypothetical protein Q8P92_00995 [Candidatus Daviesbacteria bacterium]|nr:hypothetical protein [Candidatus Daviesbacteria bacterium]
MYIEAEGGPPKPRIPLEIPVIDVTDRVTLPNGRRYSAASLVYSKTIGIKSFNEVACQALGVDPRVRIGSKLHAQLVEMITSHSRQGGKAITPIVIKYNKGLHYRLITEQEESFIHLLRQNRDKIECNLPFYVNEDELQAFRKGNVEVMKAIRGRVKNLGVNLALSQGASLSEAEEMAESVMRGSSIWGALDESVAPVATSSNFQKLFRTAIYRRFLNRHRGQEKAKEIAQRETIPLRFLEGSPLKKFFSENPPGSFLAERLLHILNDDSQAAFMEHYLNGGHGSEVAQKLGVKGAKFVSRYHSAKKRLEEIVGQPIHEWPSPHITVVVSRLRQNHPDFWFSFLAEAFPKMADYATMKYGERRRDEEIAGRLDMSVGAVKAFGHRFRIKIAREALKMKIIHPQEMNLGS